MQMISNLVDGIQTIAVVLGLILLVLAGIGFYFYKHRRGVVTEKNIDNSDFNRKESASYIKFDDVTDDMIVADGGTRFIGAIKCQGFSYAEAEVEEKLQTIRGYVSFLNVLDNNPIQFRQSSRDVNLDSMIKDYQKQITEMESRRFLLNLDYEELKLESENPELTSEDYDVYYEKLKLMQKELLSLGYQIGQLSAQVEYMNSISGDNAEAERDEIYVFDWEYHTVDFSSQELDKQEIYQRAETQLRNKASAYIGALRNCGVYAKRMRGVELLEEMKRYTHPISSAKVTSEDILQSSFDSICVTSHSLHNMEQQANKKIIDSIASEVMREEM